MNYFYIPAGIVLFMFLVGFAMKNNTPVELHYYLGYTWRLPMSLLLLIVFSAGIVIGISACIGSLIRQRRRMMKLDQELKALNNTIHAGQN